jgi:hypothetical protein
VIREEKKKQKKRGCRRGAGNPASRPLSRPVSRHSTTAAVPVAYADNINPEFWSQQNSVQSMRMFSLSLRLHGL